MKAILIRTLAALWDRDSKMGLNINTSLKVKQPFLSLADKSLNKSRLQVFLSLCDCITPTTSDSMMMEEIYKQVYSCKRCQLWEGTKHAVPGEGPFDAKVMVVGQNPGADEDESGRPFVGRAGKYLTKTLAEFGIHREELFITNIVKHTSPKNRKPSPAEVETCLPYLQEQIRIIQPKIIILLGASAKETPRIDGIKYFEVIHPSAAMRFTKMREKFRTQISELAEQIKQTQ